MQKKQAQGVDTRMMVPVYAGVFVAVCQLFLPWLNIPQLRYSMLPVDYTVFRTHEAIENLQICVTTGGRISMEAMTPAEMALLHRAASGMEAVSLGVMALLLITAAAVFLRREKSCPLVRVTFVLVGLWQAGLLILSFAGSAFVNSKMGVENGFSTLTLHSELHLTSWVYAQLLISLGVAAAAGRLMDVTREAGPQKYIERTQRDDRHMGRRTKACLLLIVVAIPLVIFFGIYFLNDRSNVFIGLCIICLAMLPFAMVFEDRQPQARELLLIAVISAIAVVGRMAFFMLPQFKPVTAIVIIAGVGLGAEAGFLTGAVSGFVSNFFFGQGPWTPWQMFAYGIIGFIAGVIFNRSGSKKNRSRKWERIHLTLMCIYGAFATFFLYGGIMDVSSVINMVNEFSWAILLAKLASGVPFNFIHAVSTVVFLYFLARPIERKLDRIKKKYGILEV